MGKEEMIEKFVNAVKKFETGLKYDIIVESFSHEIEDGEEYLECEMTYQIDTRIDRLDSEIVKQLEAEFENEFNVSVDKEDAYPNGYAYYRTSFSK